MSHHRVRFQAALLLTVLLGGSFGLPLLDALVFHRTTSAAPRPTLGKETVSQDSQTPAHALGCALLTSAASGKGLPAVGLGQSSAPTDPNDAAFPACTGIPSETNPSLHHSRAPPAV
jgi:hypothetical protein